MTRLKSSYVLLLLTAVLSCSVPVQGSTLLSVPSSVLSIPRGGARTESHRRLAKHRKVALVASSETTPLDKDTGASIPNEVFNLAKAIVGVGALSLPAGIAAFGNAPSAAIPAAILIAMMGLLSGYGFCVIGKVCAYTGATSYRQAWTRSVGEATSWIPAWSTTLKTFLSCLACSMVLADSVSNLIGQPRTETLGVLTTCVLLPLCLLKNLKSLAPFSLLGVLGMAYTTLAMTVRYFDGSYPVETILTTTSSDTLPQTVGKQTLASQVAPHLRPSFGDQGMASVFQPSSLILVCMLSTAYMAHFNAPKFYAELKNPTLPRFYAVTHWGFGISMLLTTFITTMGFLTFGGHCAGSVLNNYASKDVWMRASRFAVAISLTFSYPLAFVGCRDGILDLLKISNERRTDAVLRTLTVAILGIVTALACTLTNVSLVLAVGGATLGNALAHVFPAIMYRAVVQKQGRDSEQLGVFVSMVSAVLGIVMGAIGATMAIQSVRS